MKTKTTTSPRLGELAGIRGGYPFRGQVKHTPDAWNYYVLQLKDVQKDGRVELAHAARVNMTGTKPPQPLIKGDILLRARGGYYYSGLFDADPPNVIAAGQFFVLSPKTGIIDPAYLCWYLNQPVAQQYLAKNDSGSNIPMLNKQTISHLPVKLPSLPTQQKIARIHQGWLKEKALIGQLLHNRERMVRGLCQQLIKKEWMNRETP